MTAKTPALTRPSRHDEWRQTLLVAWQERRSLPTFSAPDDCAWAMFHADPMSEVLEPALGAAALACPQ